MTLVFINLEVINLDSSYLESLDESFRLLELPKLHTLIVNSCSIASIDREALAYGKDNLRKLVLSNNAIRNLIWLTTRETPLYNLRHLDLSSNRLSHLPLDMKNYVPNLKVLNLDANQF